MLVFSKCRQQIEQMWKFSSFFLSHPFISPLINGQVHTAFVFFFCRREGCYFIMILLHLFHSLCPAYYSLCLLFVRGVFSALIEKHFPAPNRAKMAGMFGLSFDSDLKTSVKEKHSKRKRKRGEAREIVRKCDFHVSTLSSVPHGMKHTYFVSHQHTWPRIPPLE